MKIPRKVYDEMLEHARSEVPNECCGLVGGKDGEAVSYHRTTNTEASNLRYRIDPLEQRGIEDDLKEKGYEMVAIFHSHPNSEAYPSPTDVNLAFWTGDVAGGLRNWPDAVFLIASLKEGETPLRGFEILDKGIVREVELSVE